MALCLISLTLILESILIEDAGSELIPVEKKKTKNRRISFTDVVNGNVEQPSVQEFNNLVSFEDDDLSQRLTRFQGQRFNKIGQLNLVKTVLPFDQNRVKLKNPIDGYDYINASLISQPSFEDRTYDEVIYSDILSCKNVRIIVGQDPLPHTLPHHWALIHENEIDFIVNFTKKSLKFGKVYAVLFVGEPLGFFKFDRLLIQGFGFMLPASYRY